MRRALCVRVNCGELVELADIYVPVAASVEEERSHLPVHGSAAVFFAGMGNCAAAALLLLAARIDAFSALSKTTYSEGGGGLHPDTIAWQQHLGLNECSPGDLIKGRCGNVGDVAAYIEANRRRTTATGRRGRPDDARRRR